MKIEALFQHLKKNAKRGAVSLSIHEIETLLKEELSFSAKTNDRYWRQPKIKSLMKEYNVSFCYIDTKTGTIHFIVD